MELLVRTRRRGLAYRAAACLERAFRRGGRDRRKDTARGIVLTELLHGARKSSRPDHNRHEVRRFAARLAVLPYDEAAAEHAGDIRAALEQKGLQIGAYDVLIACHARSRGLVVVTGNLSEFERVDGLQCEN